MKIHNTLKRKLEEFIPVREGEVKMYLCGPTVYDFAHLGHGRSAVSFDVIRRYFIYKNYKVTYISNYTDIDDKMIQRANAEHITVVELAQKIIPHYIEDYGKLNILPNDISPLATQYVDEMIAIISKLETEGMTYKIEDGIYFDISKDSDYGKLSGQDISKLEAGARVEEVKSKRNPEDFVLWKFAKPGEPLWESPWGKGRPGWHIECSAMSMKLLGETFDIHAGGLDLIFPHHECEIAQSESATHLPYVKYWLHNGFVQVDNEKMSKSLGNFFTLKDIFSKYPPRAVRLFLISTHYRGPINYSTVQLDQAVQTLKRIEDFIFNVKNIKSGKFCDELEKINTDALTGFEGAMDIDFEVPKALSVLFDYIKIINKLIDENSISLDQIDSVLDLIKKIDSVLGILDPSAFDTTESLDSEIEKLISERETCRINKDYAKADELRDILKQKGIEILDGKDGIKWRRI